MTGHCYCVSIFIAFYLSYIADGLIFLSLFWMLRARSCSYGDSFNVGGPECEAQ